MNRRHFVRTSSLAASAALLGTRPSPAADAPAQRSSTTRPNPAAGPANATGQAGAHTAPFDRAMQEFMASRQIPGGALAVARDGRLILARGYGWADRDQEVPATASALFRIASISKPVTAAAILQLAEKGRLDLDAPALPLAGIQPANRPGARPDRRLGDITVRHLLQHTAGWDRDESFDPMFRPGPIARALGASPPAGPSEVIQYMLGEPLQFTPGTRYAYSNLGYCLLGRLVERLSGQSYETHVRSSILAPCGIRRMRLGRTLEAERAPDEVRYYTPEKETAKSVFPSIPGPVPAPYGGFNLEAMDAHGGWIASAVDLVRFAVALDQPNRCPILSPRSHAIMLQPPAPPVSRQPDGSLEPTYYGGGWMIRPVGPDHRCSFWHSGSLPGTATLLVRRFDHLIWAALFNQRSNNPDLPDTAIDPALHEAARAVANWPDHDLFPEFT